MEEKLMESENQWKQVKTTTIEAVITDIKTKESENEI